MPSTKKRKLKDLYLACSIGELNSLADPDIPANKNANPLLYCNSADKVFVKATDFDVVDDEENAFVFYMRYFKIVSLIKSTTKYKQDKSHFDKLLGVNKPLKAIERAEKLQKSLTKRYEEASKQKEDEEMAKRLLQKNKEQEEAKAKATKANSSSSHADDDLDDLLDSSGINSSSEVYQKLKVSHSSVLRPQSTNSDNGDILGIFETPSPLLPGMGVAIPCITAEELYQLTKTEDSRNMLVIDIRPQAEYTKNRILHSSCINVPAEMLEHGVSVSNIERRLLEKTRLMWRQRGNKQHVIILDKSTRVSEVSPQSLIQQLKDAIYKYDSHCTLQKEPAFLDGGFDSWLWHYPSLATRSELPQAQVSPKIDLPGTTDLSSLDYPELPEEKEDKPTALIIPDAKVDPQNAEPKHTVGEMTNGIYPSMPDDSTVFPGTGHGMNRGIDVGSTNTGIHTGIVPNNHLPVLPPGQTTMGMPGPSQTVTPGIPSGMPTSTLGMPTAPHPVNTNKITPNEPSVTGQLGVNRTVKEPVGPAAQLGPQSAGGSNISFPQTPLPGIVPPPASQPPGGPPTGILPTPRNLPTSGTPSAAVGGQSPTNTPSRHPPSNSQSTTNHPTSPARPTMGPGNAPLPKNQMDSQLPTVKDNSKSTVYTELVFPDKASLPNSQRDSKLPTVRGSNKSSNYAELVFPDNKDLPVSSTKVPHSVSGAVPGKQPVDTRGPAVPGGQVPRPGTQGRSTSQPQGSKGSGYVTTAGLPLGWEKSVDQSTGRIFYRDHNTKTTQWVPPSVVPGAGIAMPQKSTQQQPPNQPSTASRQQPTPVQPQVHQQRTSHPTPHHQPTMSRQQPGGTQPATTPHQPTTIPSVAPSIRPTVPPQTQPAVQPNLPRQPVVQPSRQTAPKGLTPNRPEQAKSNLRRSLSSPNLAKLDSAAGKPPARPLIDRSSKPADRPAFTRNSKPMTTLKIESLNPVHGGIGCGLTGLRNLGNTCYMNSVLQCLFATAPLAAYFVSGAFRDDINMDNPLGTRGVLAQQFSILVRTTNSGRYKSISPSDFKRAIGTIKSSFAGFDQQDSQEFLALMMDKLHEDVNKIQHKPYLKAPEDDINPALAADITWDNHKLRNESIMLNLFDGMFKSTVCCLTCKKESVTFETFSNLTLPLPSNRNHCSLQDCIARFTQPERMSGDDKWYCPRCKQHREASKQLQIWRLPPILVIHLKRFQYDGMWRQKLQTAVSFPCQNLDISSQRPRSPYHLYGVSNHYGTMHGGHYTAFCKNAHNKRWYKFDDQVVTEMSPRDIVTSAAYLLFYTSIEFTPPKLI